MKMNDSRMKTNNNLMGAEERRQMFREPIPPHERNKMMYADFFDEKIEDCIKMILGDEDAAFHALSRLNDAPPEIRILAIQLFNLMKLQVNVRFPNSRINTMNARFDSLSLEQENIDVYTRLYGENGKRFVDILALSPDEIAIVSRMIAHVQESLMGKEE